MQRQSFLDLDRIDKNTKIEVKILGNTFHLTLDQIRKLYLDKMLEWDRREFAQRLIRKTVGITESDERSTLS